MFLHKPPLLLSSLLVLLFACGGIVPRTTTLVEANPEALIYEQEVVGHNEDESAALIVVPINGVEVAAFGGEGNSAGAGVSVDASIVDEGPLPDDDGPLVLSAVALALESGAVDEVLLEGNQIDLSLLAQGKSSDNFQYFQMKGAVKKDVELDFFQKSCPFALIIGSQQDVPRNENLNKVNCTNTVARDANTCVVPDDRYLCFFTTVTVLGPNVKRLIPFYQATVKDERFRRVLAAPTPNGFNIESRNWVPLPPKDNDPPTRRPTRRPTRKPTTSGLAWCSAAPSCRGLIGNCCPTDDGVFLQCCNDERRPTARPNPSPTRRPTAKPTPAPTIFVGQVSCEQLESDCLVKKDKKRCKNYLQRNDCAYCGSQNRDSKGTCYPKTGKIYKKAGGFCKLCPNGNANKSVCKSKQPTINNCKSWYKNCWKKKQSGQCKTFLTFNKCAYKGAKKAGQAYKKARGYCGLCGLVGCGPVPS